MYGEINALVPKGTTATDIHELVNETSHHALINQSQVLANTLQSLIKKTMEGIVYKEPNRGPVYFTTSNYKNQ